MKEQMREANRHSVNSVIIIGDEELKEKVVIVKDMITSNQEKIPFSDVINYFNNKK